MPLSAFSKSVRNSGIDLEYTTCFCLVNSREGYVGFITSFQGLFSRGLGKDGSAGFPVYAFRVRRLGKP
jgi:hypothetical protein